MWDNRVQKSGIRSFRFARCSEFAAMSESALLFEDIFSITGLDPDGKKFDKVSRIVAHSEQFDMDVLLDVNIDIYPLSKKEKFTLALASTLSLDGAPDDGTFDQSRRKSLADKYEYVMYGKVYKYSDTESSGSPKVEVYVSFGGLLMCLKGDPNNLSSLQLDQRVYLLMRKVGWIFLRHGSTMPVRWSDNLTLILTL